MAYTEIELTIGGDRKGLRTNLVNAFMDEEPGTGKGECATTYCYIVETTESGFQIQLLRPAFLNKGIDFVVNVPGVKFNNSRMRRFHSVPRHDDIVALMSTLRDTYPHEYPTIASAITTVYNCQEPESLRDIADLRCAIVENDDGGIPADVGILATKWLFAEQDLTYWNYSGRAMLFGELESEGLVA